MKHRGGDVREDGYVFAQYVRKNGKLYPLWLSPEARKRDLETRRARIAAKRANAQFKAREQEKKNASRREKYANDADYRKRAIEKAIVGEQRRSKCREWIEKRLRNKRKRYSNRYRTDTSFRARCVEKQAQRRRAQFAQLTDVEKRIVRAVYESASRVSLCTGICHHVDHVVPVARGGKHVPGNLQILPARINQRKHAKLEWHLP